MLSRQHNPERAKEPRQKRTCKMCGRRPVAPGLWYYCRRCRTLVKEMAKRGLTCEFDECPVHTPYKM